MEESKKKPIMIAVIVVCLGVAGAVTYVTRSGDKGINSIAPDKTTWVICRAPDCEASYEMNLREYFEYLEEHGDPRSPIPPALICEKCGQESVYRAIKCAKCDLVFERGTVERTFADQCPKCGYSQIREDRKAAAGK